MNQVASNEVNEELLSNSHSESTSQFKVCKVLQYLKVLNICLS